ncbi:MAG: hypothetical protein H0T90_08175 [Gemmatimonadales bacterium]|nr:hypothetical protein [Gemmatimonadales bacterium]
MRLHHLPLTAMLLLPAAALAQTEADTARTHLSLGGAAPAISSEAELRNFLDDLEVQEFALGEAAALEWYYQWKGERYHQAGPVYRLIAELQTRRDYARVIERWQERVEDSVLARRLEIHAKDFLSAKADAALTLARADLQTAIQDTFRHFRYTVAGQEVTQTALAELVDTSADRELRRSAFEAKLQITERTSEPIRRAMALTDRLARQGGFANGAERELIRASLTPAQVIRDLAQFERATRPAYLAMLDEVRRDLQVEQVEPWDLGYWFRLQEAEVADAYPQSEGVTRLRELVRELGFAVDSLPITVTIWDVPTGGIAFPIRPAYEARLLSNPFTGSRFYQVLFHEYGHTLNLVHLRPDQPLIFLQTDETPMSEGLAETIGHFAYDRHWLERAAGLEPEQAVALERLGKLQQLLWLRRTIGLNAWAEIRAYQNRRADLDSLYRASHRHFLALELPPGDHAATRDFFGTSPLYFQSYLYANMIAAQLREAMRAELGVEDLSREPRVAEWLIERFYAPGASVPWPVKIRRATGRELDASALARYLATAPVMPVGPSQ